MHWIARHILKELAVADTRAYTQLLPDGVEGNLFQYHARALERDGYILRGDGGYQLTAAGRDLVGSMSLTRSMRRSDIAQPVVMIYAQDTRGRILLFRWRRQPYRGLVSLPFGRSLRGRSVLQMAAEQLRAKAGYDAEFGYLGQISLVSPDQTLLMSVVAATNLVSVNPPDGLTGVVFWGSADYLGDDMLPGLQEIITWCAGSERPALLELIHQ
jgi:8-oxo-dGTP pyrophosphatase MutT (NUDIX family)